MTAPAGLRSTPRRRRVLAAAGVVVAVSAAAAALAVWDHPAAGRPHVGAAAEATAAALLMCSAAGLVLAALWTSERWPIAGRRRLQRIGIHAATATTTSVVVAGAEAAAHANVAWVGAPFGVPTAVQHVPGYVAVAVFAHLVRVARRATRSRVARIRLRRALARAGREHAAANLRAIKAELHPVLVAHALATARGLLCTDPGAAERVVVQLGDLMREAVAAAAVEEVALEDEIGAALGRSIDGADDGTAIAFDVEPAANALLVPHLTIPTLLACAAEFGWSTRGLVLRARRGPDAGLMLSLSGERRAAPAPLRPSAEVPALCAAVFRRQLRQMYGAGAELAIRSASDPGIGPIVRLSLPAGDDGVSAPRGAAPLAAETARDGRAFDAWLSVTAADAPAPTTMSDAWFVAALSAALTLLQWKHVADAWGAAWASVPVVLISGLYGLTLAGTAAAAVATTRRYPVGMGESTDAALRAHVAAALCAAVLGTAARFLAGWFVRGPALVIWTKLSLAAAVLRLPATVAVYALFAAVAHLVVFARDRRHAARIADGLRAARTTSTRQQVASELRALKAELNPHFVGNALHTAAELVRHDPEAASQLLGALTQLADAAGSRPDTQEVSLAEEVAGLEPFLALERARLGIAGGALAVVWNVSEDVLGAAVPHLLLQPLAENAVRHGLAPRGGAGRLEIAAHRVGPDVELRVSDDGVGVARPSDRRGSTGTTGGGAGLGGVRRRLALLYGVNAACVLEPAPGGGTVARVTFPYRRAASVVDAGVQLAAAGG